MLPWFLSLLPSPLGMCVQSKFLLTASFWILGQIFIEFLLHCFPPLWINYPVSLRVTMSPSLIDPSPFLVPQLSRKLGAVFTLKEESDQSFMWHVHLYEHKERRELGSAGKERENPNKYPNPLRDQVEGIWLPTLPPPLPSGSVILPNKEGFTFQKLKITKAD